MTDLKYDCCLHRYTKGGVKIIQLCPLDDILDGTRLPLTEEERKEFVKDAYNRAFHKANKKYGISEADKDVYDKWDKRIKAFYAPKLKQYY